jgi:hypothetical protein
MKYLGEYITRQKHDKYPAGSKCKAYRKDYNILALEMEDGETIEILGGYAKGLEPPFYSLVDMLVYNSVMDMQAIEDRKVFEAIDDTIKDLENHGSHK